jgi:hypothetical protein
MKTHKQVSNIYIFKQHNIFDLNGKSEEDVTLKHQKELLFVAINVNFKMKMKIAGTVVAVIVWYSGVCL